MGWHRIERGRRFFTLIFFLYVVAAAGLFLPGEAKSSLIITETWSTEDIGDGLGVQPIVRFRVWLGLNEQDLVANGKGLVEFLVGNNDAGWAGIGEANNLPTYSYSMYYDWDRDDVFSDRIDYTESVWMGSTAWKDDYGIWHGGYGETLDWMTGVTGFEDYSKAFLFTTNPDYAGNPYHPGWTSLSGGGIVGTDSYGFMGSTQRPQSPFAVHVLDFQTENNETTLLGDVVNTTVPEPAILLFFGLGIAGLASIKRRYSK
jgi:hypothetical protein